MKTQIAILIAAIIFSNTPLNVSAEVTYLITEEDTIIGTSLEFGLFNAKLKDADGQTTKIDKDKVSSYFQDGKRYDKLPIYMENKNTGKESFMELVSQRNDLKLYKFRCPMNPKVNNQEACILAIYKGKDFYVQVDSKNAKTIAEFFHLSNIVVN